MQDLSGKRQAVILLRFVYPLYKRFYFISNFIQLFDITHLVLDNKINKVSTVQYIQGV